MKLRKILIAFLIFLSVNIAWAKDRPRIGLIYAKKYAKKLPLGKDELKTYRQALEYNGADVVALMETYSDDVLKSQLSKIDGLLIPGGRDINPKFYNEKPYKKLGKTDEAFDEFEMKIIKYAVKHNIPIMGICRGHQIINVYFGGSLIQDIPTQYKSKVKVIHRIKKGRKTKPCYHNIYVKKDSFLYKTLKQDILKVNSFHHQAVKKLAKGFRITSVSEDGIVESMEYNGFPFIVSFQFHPERMRLENPDFNKIFLKFIEITQKNKKRR